MTKINDKYTGLIQQVLIEFHRVSHLYLSIVKVSNIIIIMKRVVNLYLTNLYSKYNRLISKMSLQRLIFLAVLMVMAYSFAKNCRTFNSTNYNNCLVCQQGYYPINEICVTCPSNKNMVKQCSKASVRAAPTSTQIVSVKSVSAENNITPMNKAENILANAFGQISGAVTIQPASNTDIDNKNSSTQNGGNGTNTSNINVKTNQNGSTTTNKTTQNSSSNSNSSTSNINSTQTSEKTASPTSAATTFTPPQVNELSQILFKYLPPHCCQFSVVPIISCTACQPNYILTANSTCQPSPQTKPPAQGISSQPIPVSTTTPTASPSPSNQASSLNQASQSIPSDLKVTASISSNTGSLPIVVIDPPASLISSNPQPIFIPIVAAPTTPRTTNNASQPQNASQNSTNVQTSQPTNTSAQANPPRSQSSSTNAVFMPRKGQIKDQNCLYPNPKFDFNKPVSVENARCTCYKGFYYDLNKQICLPLNPLCQNVTSQNQCTACYMGYILIRGNCLINHGQYTVISSSTLPVNPQQDPNCQTYQPDSTICSVCSNRYYFDSTTKICVQVDSSCKSWNSTNGYCTQCYTGYMCGSNDKVCKPIPPPSSSSSSSNGIQTFASYCTKKVNNKCTACAHRFFLNNGICLPVSDQCSTFNPNFGYCLSCYSGYELNDGECQEIKAPVVSSDQNCATYTQQGCQACYVGNFVNSQGWCQMVSPFCNGYNPQNGYCLACVSPYTLDPTTGQCLYYP